MESPKGYKEALRRIEKVKQKNEHSLNLTELQLTSLPVELFELTLLSTLNLSYNELKIIPDSIGKLVSLQSLSLDNNQLNSLPDSIGNLTSLQLLYIYYNRLSTLPHSIGNLTSLQLLSVFSNQLNSLPDSIGNLASLQSFFVYNNQLNSLPDSIGNLASLQNLYVDNNQLNTLPVAIGNLASLLRLVVSSNQLNSLPESFKNLSTLKELYLHGNPLLKIPPDILGPEWDKVVDKKVKSADPQKILEYYFRTRKEKRPLNEAKLIIVGRGEVGKTSLVNRLIENKFNKRQRKTDGIKITNWEVELKKNDKVRLNVWDFGGQEIMHATHQFFLTERSLYLLVLDGRSGLEERDAEYWLKIISSFGADSPVIIVLNKIKVHPFNLNMRALQEKYPFIKSFIKTDCADNTGIKLLLKEIKKQTDALENLRVPFPAVWFDIKEKIAGMKQNYLLFKDFKKFCIDNGESADNAHESLAYFLHQLGIALNYKDDPRLKETHILNPYWLTEGIYKILNSDILAEKNGEITAGDLPKILDKQKYPKDMHCFLLELMRKFELCFPTPKKENSFLIPELLGKEEPKETKEFNPVECLNFQYNYSVLPNGLLPRFIVRTYALSESLRRWRTGVFLQLEGCKAMVKADIDEKKVFISIGGNIEKRRNLLALIRSDFERIHSDIKNLLPDEMVPYPDFPRHSILYNKLLEMEKNNKSEFDEYINGKIVSVKVKELLNGVDIVKQKEGAAKVFISYSHEDEFYKNKLESIFKILKRKNIIETWDDTQINAGSTLDKTVDKNLESAEIIIGLISNDYFASDYCYEVEYKRALTRHYNNEGIFIPIIIRQCPWKKEELSNIKLLPKDGKPIKHWTDKDIPWTFVSDEIEKTVKKLVPLLRTKKLDNRILNQV